MNRRKFIGAVGSVSILGIAGCSTNPDSSDSANTGVRSHSFNKIPSEDAPDEPEITNVQTTDDDAVEVTVQGTVRVRNSCIDIRIGSEPEMTSEDPVRIETMIGTYKAEDGMCAEVITPIGYELTFTCRPPAEEVVVSQAGVNSQSTTLGVSSE